MDREIKKGIILKGVGGFYTVLTDGVSCVCKARGLFRKQHLVPMVGDRVEFSMNADGSSGYLWSINERKNALPRPMVANIDKLFIVIAAGKPEPDLLLVDKLLLYCEKYGIEPIIIINKCDAAKEECALSIEEEYRLTDYKLYKTSTVMNWGIDELRNEIKDSIVCFAGQSAVGKSSIINALLPGMKLEVGELSKKTDRGRHTTRHVELIPIGSGGAVLDTPGFSFLDSLDCEPEEVKNFYPELRRHASECRFIGCLHITEPGCVVKTELIGSSINKARYNRYVRLVMDAVENKKHRYE